MSTDTRLIILNVFLKTDINMQNQLLTCKDNIMI